MQSISPCYMSDQHKSIYTFLNLFFVDCTLMSSNLALLQIPHTCKILIGNKTLTDSDLFKFNFCLIKIICHILNCKENAFELVFAFAEFLFFHF